ncbi:MAG: hypothetical protein RLZ98_2954 [Pseudomonadota bacterium]|jgi:F-type H+-transporting ATPase subunit epsilon
MAETFQFELVSPERVLMSTSAEQVVVPGSEGDFAILPRHAPVISTLRPGILDVTLPEGRKRVFVKGGFAQMDNDVLTILVEHAIGPEGLDAAGVAKAIEEAEADLRAAVDDRGRKAANDALDALRQFRAGAH